MIHFVPVKDYRGQLPSHDLSIVVSDDLSERSAGMGGHVIGIVKEHICVLSFDNGLSYGHDAALTIAMATAGIGISMPEAHEGAASLRAAQDGLLRINEDALCSIHSMGSVRLNSLHNNGPVLKGQVVAGVRVDSTTAGDEVLQKIEKICHECSPVFDVVPFRPLKVGIVVIDPESQSASRKETANPVLQEKFMTLGSSVIGQERVSDDRTAEVAAVCRLIEDGAEMVVCAGGRRCGSDVRMMESGRVAAGETWAVGALAMPESEVSWTLISSIPILRLPGTVLHQRVSLFDSIVPRFLAGVEIGQGGLAVFGQDGLRVASP